MIDIVTPFPTLLDFSFFAPLILRLALGMFMLNISREKTTEPQPALTPIEIIYRAFFIVAGISLIIGLYTQVAALIVIALMLISLFDIRARLIQNLKYRELILIIVIAFSLLFTGAGPLAFDLPL